jgi:polyhydroxybutyrate depolymerase
VTRISSRCPPGRDVVLYRVNNGGHRMPGSFPDARFPRVVNLLLGPQNHDIDGAEAIWAFFRKFP